MQPGHGHYEINMTKAIIHLLFKAVGEDLAKLLGFRSPKALQAFHDANDHHKSWQVVEILLFGTADELLLPFVRETLSAKGEITVDNYYQWLSRCCNPNYKFLMEAVFTYHLSLYLFRIGLRRNNSQYILSGRMKFAPLLYGLNKLNYQQIDFLHWKSRVLAPPEIKCFQEANETISPSGHPSKGEGFDFVVESTNKKTKSCIPSGTPTEVQWTRVCRNIDRLDKVRQNIETFLEIENETPMYHCNLDNEITSWRSLLRSKKYLLSPFKECNHTSLSGNVLDTDLVNFSEKSKSNISDFYNTIKKTNNLSTTILEPIFIEKKDRIKFHALENKTKNEIKELILEEIELLRDLEHDEEADLFERKWRMEIKNSTKPRYIGFLKEVKLTFNEVTEADNVLVCGAEQQDFKLKYDDGSLVFDKNFLPKELFNGSTITNYLTFSVNA